jgi:CHAD domain-containing protein
MRLQSISEYANRQTEFRLKQFLEQRRRAAESIDAMEAIHDLRVSIRRLQQALRTFRGLLAPAKKIRKRLRKLMALCAAVRNCDVALGVLKQAGAATNGRNTKLGVERQEAELALQERLTDRRRWKKRKWVKLLCSQPQKHADWHLEQSIEDNLARVLPMLAHDFFAAGRIAAKMGNLEALHRFRLRAKRFRYTLELFRTCYGDDIKECLQQLRELQEYLGEINDCVTTIAMLNGDGDAAEAIRRLLLEREAKFKRHWRRYTTRREKTWKEWLSRPRVVIK